MSRWAWWGAALAAAAMTMGCGDDGSTSGTSGTPTGSASGSGGSSAGSGGGTGQGGGDNSGGGGMGQGGMPDLGDPIDAPDNQWTWVGFDDALCANGSTTGLALNPSPDAALVLIYLQGGGACWDEQSCYVNQLAANIETGFGEADLAGLAGQLNAGAFDRTDTTNPFQNASYVFVPYCTGDLYIGNTTTTHGNTPTMHVGYANMNAYLSRLVPTFPGATKVVLAGGSAGGYGATFNFAQTQFFFGDIRVDLLNDSGPILPAAQFDEGLEQAMRTAWGMDANLPAGCTQCTEDLDALYGYLASSYPNSRSAFLTYTTDNTIQFYFGITAGEFSSGLQSLGTSYFNPNEHWQYFAVQGAGHVLMTPAWSALSSGGVPLKTWVTQMVSDDPSWASVP